MLKRNLQLFVNAPLLVQARLALFYGYYTDILLKDDQEKFNESMKFLFEAINNPPETIVVGHHACETLMTLIGDKNVAPRLGPMVRTKKL